MADLNDQIGAAERRLSEIDSRLAELRAERIDETDVAAALADFDSVWGALSPREQARVIKLLVERVEFDAAVGAIEVSFHAAGIKALANGDHEAAENVEDAA
jgi:site-specific DNA recombinase